MTVHRWELTFFFKEVVVLKYYKEQTVGGELKYTHPQRGNVTAFVVGLKNGHIHKNLTKISELQRYSWECRRRERRNTPEVMSKPGAE